VAVQCPNCGSFRFYYVQETTEYYTIDAIYEEGNVDLLALHDTFPKDDFHFFCEDCGNDYSVKEYFDRLNQKDEVK
jgi:hypothetical protein